MEQNKFEQQLKEKLEGRVIEPSAKSWDRLDAMLSVKEKPKKKSFLWYYVAASFFFAFGIIYWIESQGSNEEIVKENTVVISPESDILKIDKQENSTETKVETLDLIKEVKSNHNSVIVQNKVGKETKREDRNVKILQKNEVFENNLVEPFANNPEPKTHKFVSPEKLLASVENNQGSITIANSSTTKKAVNVNANSLLSSVENEIKEEYRETTFDKLKRKFEQAKTAVANRNYE
ncbi:MAG: hypothetical protein IE891_08015 [Flavobacteriaceae bacterium]|nr:hypothetical protein [Flavobacteriaceae bacterium]